ncbi:MAG TPA: CehA/McbA family metallohydrolase [Kofleriaceae bacterium]|nr:CehA/McbA family metallohydrolase [Kofleriaceae bacterium]
MLPLALGAVLSMMHLEGDVLPAGGDFAVVELVVPAGTREIRIAHTDGSDAVILDWGVWGPDGFRGWGGGNTEDAIIGVDESSRSYRIGPITPGTWQLVIGKAQLPPAGAHYVVDVVCRDDATLPVRPRAPAAPATLASGRRWYRGDFHVHSSESGDANATFAQIAALARTRGLDFVNLSDHNTDSHLPLAAAAQAATPDVLFLRGAEITTYAGHGNAVGLAAYVDHRIGFGGRTIGQVLGDVAAQGALFLVNHPSLDLGDNCIGCAWSHAATPWEQIAGLEIITGTWDVVERLFVPRAVALWDDLAAQGFRIAAVGGSDDHRAGAGTGANDSAIGSPTTLVLADELTEAAILEGIRRGRTIVQLRGPDDPRVDLRIGAAEIGDDVDGVEVAELDVSVRGGAGTFVQLWRDGAKLAQVEVVRDDFTHRFEDRPGAADRRYRIELIDGGNRRLVVTSHIYVHGVTGGGCGCGAGTGGAPGTALAACLIALGLGRGRPGRRRRRERRGD